MLQQAAEIELAQSCQITQNGAIALANPAGSTVTVYDPDGRVTAVIDPDGNETDYQYDDDGRRTLTTDALGREQAAQYDADGNLRVSVDRDGRRKDMSYDAVGRLTAATWYNADGSIQDQQNFVYDLDGNVLAAANAAGAYGFSYDADNRVLTETTPDGLTLGFTYDADGNVLTASDSNGVQLTNGYDADGRLNFTGLSGTIATPVQATLTYDPNGLPRALVRAVGGADVAGTVYSYDDAGDVIDKQTTGGGGTAADYAFGYDAGSRLISETIDGAATSYLYDGQGQLAGASGATNESYAYDPNGNRGTAAIGPNNEVLAAGTWAYSYDAEGDRSAATDSATGDSWAYAYNDANQLTGVTETDGGGTVVYQVAYAYDVFGNRVEQDVWQAGDGAPTVQRYAYDGDRIWADLDVSGGPTTYYLNGAAVDEVLARETSDGAVAFYLTDQLGSVRDLLDDTGTVQDHVDYDSFGNVINESAPTLADRFTAYAGMQRDGATGLLFDHARDYDPGTGVFTTQDPTAFDAGDSNLYRYVGNDPTNETDPNGLKGIGQWLRERWDSAAAYTHELVVVQGGYALNTAGTALKDTAEGLYHVAVTPGAGRAFLDAWQSERIDPMAERLKQKAEFRRGDSNASGAELFAYGLEDMAGAKIPEAAYGADLTGKEIPGGLWDGGARTQHLALGVADAAGTAAMIAGGFNAGYKGVTGEPFFHHIPGTGFMDAPIPGLGVLDTPLPNPGKLIPEGVRRGAIELWKDEGGGVRLPGESSPETGATAPSTGGEWVRPKGWRLPRNGTWEGTRGDSNFIPNNPAELGLEPGEVVPFGNGRPDFSKWSKGNFTSKEPLTGEWAADRPKMIRAIAQEKGWTQAELEAWLESEQVSLHHGGGDRIQLIPRNLHGNPSSDPPIQGIRHMGGAYDLRNP